MALPVVVPAAPRSAWLGPCLAAARADGALGVYVVSEERPSDPDVRWVAVPTGAGFAARANAGLGAARDDGHAAALLLNDDTELRPGTLRSLRDAVGDGIAGAVLEEFAGGVQQAGMTVNRRTGRVLGIRREPEASRAPRDAVSGAAMALSLDLWARLGGFDEEFTFYFEDVDLCLRARDIGAMVHLVREARVRHHGGGTRSGRSADAAYHLGRSHTLLAHRLGGGALRRGNVCVLALLWSLRAVGAAGPRAVLRGVRDAHRA